MALFNCIKQVLFVALCVFLIWTSKSLNLAFLHSQVFFSLTTERSSVLLSAEHSCEKGTCFIAYEPNYTQLVWNVN